MPHWMAALFLPASDHLLPYLRDRGKMYRKGEKEREAERGRKSERERGKGRKRWR